MIVFVFEVNDFGVDEHGVPVGRAGTEVEVPGFDIELVEEFFDLGLGISEVEILQGAKGMAGRFARLRGMMGAE